MHWAGAETAMGMAAGLAATVEAVVAAVMAEVGAMAGSPEAAAREEGFAFRTTRH